MWPAPMNNNVVGQRGLVDQNHMICDTNRLNHGVVSGEQGSGSSTEDDARLNKLTEDGNGGVRALIQIHEGLQVSQQQPQGPVIRWERFLPLRSIKVLLVEDDDSTRHVVSALLRNCSYEVIAVSDGLQAWKMLEDPGNCIDLVLTEVAMPVLSGLSLLCKIMSHKTLKNIPVIMMSSHDSMGIVFNCLSKGAIDFLVKPIRRNELKNLWQHVWRRCQSSSGSGSESGTQTRKSAKSRSNDVSGNNSDSSDENDVGSKGMSARDGSDNGSGTQSSWTKCPADLRNPHPVSPRNQLVDASDSTCAQVIHTKSENASGTWVHVSEKECHKQSELLDDVAMGQDFGMGISLNMQLEHRHEELTANSMDKRMNNLSDADGNQVDKGHGNVCGNGQLVYNSDKTRAQKDQVLNVIDAVTDGSSPQAESRDLNTTNGFSSISQTKASCCTKQHPIFELTFKGLGGVGDAKKVAGDERNVLRRSDLSAFSKYNSASANQAQTGNAGSCSPLDNSSVAPNTETMHNFPSHSNGTPPNQQSNGSNIHDTASTNIYLSAKGEAFDKKQDSLTGVGSFNSSAVQTVQNSSISSSHKKVSVQAENAGMVKAQVEDSEQGYHVGHNHCQLHHYNHIARNAAPELQSDHGVSSNGFEGPVESNAANFSVDASAARSDHGSNGRNGSSINLTTRMLNMESGTKATVSTEASGTDRKNSGGEGTDEGRIALREAALTKFRQKRKERCFEKRVRYYSRKKLAEQRPRIKGQFVRRIVSDAEEEKDAQK